MIAGMKTLLNTPYLTHTHTHTQGLFRLHRTLGRSEGHHRVLGSKLTDTFLNPTHYLEMGIFITHRTEFCPTSKLPPQEHPDTNRVPLCVW